MIAQALKNDMLDPKKQQEIIALYKQYLDNPSTVDARWAYVFNNLEPEAKEFLESLDTTEEDSLIPIDVHDTTSLVDSLKISKLLRAYRESGHKEAKLDPLELDINPKQKDLLLSTYGYSFVDLDKRVLVEDGHEFKNASLRSLIDSLEKSYCGAIGFEYMHLQDSEEREWIQKRAENHEKRYHLTKQERERLLYTLIQATDFEHFLHVKYPSAKRFGLEGAESTIPAIQEIVHVCAEFQMEEVVFGMAHRGRLNVLTNIIGRDFTSVFALFQGAKANPDDVRSSGDVKYHLGYSHTRFIDNREIKLSLTANPSHLEAVDPVVVGKVRAKQTLRKDKDRKKVMSLLIHGDAALAGQGIVSETLLLSQLPGYGVGGTMHVVIDNQIGFTTNPMNSRSSFYCTDIAKMIQAPVFHVNGDDVEAVAYAARCAAEFRYKFQKDVFLRIKSYRRNGHNEIDEPSFTQPRMYAKIRSLENTKDRYIKYLLDHKYFTPAEIEKLENKFKAILGKAFQDAASWKPVKADWLEGQWKGFSSGKEGEWSVPTGVSQSLLEKVGNTLLTVPENFKIHERLERVYQSKKKSMSLGKHIDWALAEALAFGTLLTEGYPVRLSGQDSSRGTFSQRHAVLVNQETEERYIPLNHIEKEQAFFEVIDSPLSEAGVLGFEYGYSNADPRTLVLWEAQFGDFTNGAQVIIDQFISSAEAKWLRMSGLVLLLPHGYEGQGPEHSSARLERFLQQSAENNWQIVYCTTPANHFHALRRQMVRNFRKPLISFTPKSLLRHRMAVSSFADMTTGTRFQEVIPEIDPHISPDKVKKVILCTGKVYYDLLSQRLENKQDTVALVRIEQLYPFPKNDLIAALKPYAKAQFVWCQEEPENMGAWTFMDRRMEEVLQNIGAVDDRLTLIARTASASTATGYTKVHEETQKKLIEYALRIES